MKDVFFVFGGNEYDDAGAPNKISIRYDKPSVADLADALKQLFKIECTLSFGFRRPTGEEITLPETSNEEVSTDRQNVVVVKVSTGTCTALYLYAN